MERQLDVKVRPYDPRTVQTNALTFPRLLLAHAQAQPESPAVREKDLGIWQTWTWRAVAQEVREIACGLALSLIHI